jgi:hypothetical protein
MSHATLPVYSSRVSFDRQFWHLLDDAVAGIRRSRRTIARTANCLEIAQRFLVECGGAPASHAFAHELCSLRALLKRVGAQVADERTDLGMEAAELDRLTVELQHKGSTRDSGSVNAFRHP